MFYFAQEFICLHDKLPLIGVISGKGLQRAFSTEPHFCGCRDDLFSIVIRWSERRLTDPVTLTGAGVAGMFFKSVLASNGTEQ